MRITLSLVGSCLVFFSMMACTENSADTDSTTTEESTAIVEEPQQDAFSISGVYEIASPTSMATVVVQQLESNTFKFEITTATQSGCTGDLTGEAMLADDRSSSFTSELCNLTFEFSEDAVTIEEGDCEVHGMQCGFTGTYEKAM